LMLKSCMGSGKNGALLSVQCWRMVIQVQKIGLILISAKSLLRSFRRSYHSAYMTLLCLS
ncbi:hypothetical protein BAE44_0002531, partial [Dichanthelium oligosanthes]